MASIGCFIASLVAVGLDVFQYLYALRVILAIIVVFLFTGAGNTLNDYYDRATDKINHPDRPIPSGKIKARSALIFSYALFCACILLSILIDLSHFLPFIIVIISMGMMIFYERNLKLKGLSGNLAISFLVSLLFLFGGAAACVDFNYAPILGVAILAALSFFATLGREIAKDIEDVKGDIDRRTLPMKLGIRKAGYISSLSFFLSIVMSPLPFLINIFKFFYLPLVLVADVIFIYCMFILTKGTNEAKVLNEARISNVSRLSKYGMIAALIAFLVGALL